MQENSIPDIILEEAVEATRQLLPAKSREHYEKVFYEFNEWKEKRRLMTINEEVQLSYFLNLKKKYSKLTAYLESQSRGYKEKELAVLERTHVEEFLTRACDNEYLIRLGVSGACRCSELTNLKISDDAYLLVSIPDTKTSISGKFTIIAAGFSINTVETFRKYMSLLPKKLSNNRFVLRYVNQKCTSQMSINMNVNIDNKKSRRQ